MSNKIALVTGATRGIGKAITEALIKENYQVIAVYKESKKLAEDLKEKFKDQIILLQADIATKEGLNTIKNELEKIGRLDVLVNNAGLNYIKYIPDITYEDYDLVLNTNLRSIVFLIQIAIPYLEKTKGVIINISSRGGFNEVAWIDTSLYCIAKAGVNNFTMSCAEAFKEKGIRVNAVIPAPTETDLLNNVFSKEEKEELISLGKIGKPSDVADLVIQLVNDNTASSQILIDKRVQSQYGCFKS